MKKEEDYIYFFHPKIKKYEYELLNTENLANLKHNNTKKNNYIDNYTTIANSIKDKILPKIKMKNALSFNFVLIIYFKLFLINIFLFII